MKNARKKVTVVAGEGTKKRYKIRFIIKKNKYEILTKNFGLKNRSVCLGLKGKQCRKRSWQTHAGPLAGFPLLRIRSRSYSLFLE